MSAAKILGDEDKGSYVQQESCEISPLLNEFPASTNILVVDSNLISLLDMKKIMKQFGYQVTVYVDAEEALVFLKTCKHEINLVIWEFHMPKINGLEALKIIDSEMDLPVVIMSDDNRTETVMEATINGACYYVTKPVGEALIANIWQHIVRKRMMTKPALIQSDLVHSDCLDENNGDSKPIDEANGEQIMENKAIESAMTWTGEIQQVQSDLDGLDRDNYDFKTISQDNMDEKEGKKPRKQRMTWTGNLHQKFLQAIEIIGGIEKANPKVLLKCLQDMEIEGLTRNNVASHLQKHRINLEETRIPQQTLEIGRSTGCRPSSLLDPKNVDTAISSYLMNGRTVNPVQQNPYPNSYLTMNNNQQNAYPNGYLTMNNDQFMTNPLPPLPYFDHGHLQQHQQQQQQQYDQLSHQLNYMMNKKESEQAYGTDHTNLELIYPSSSYDPNNFFNQRLHFDN